MRRKTGIFMFDFLLLAAFFVSVSMSHWMGCVLPSTDPCTKVLNTKVACCKEAYKITDLPKQVAKIQACENACSEGSKKYNCDIRCACGTIHKQ